MQQAYHQVRLHSDDVPKTAFTTSLGLFEYRVLPFGLSNAPSTFQALINSVLGPELRHCCLVYLDDIVVFSKSAPEHLEHLQLVLSKLKKAQLYAKLSKCKFGLTSVKFLGHIVSENGLEPDPAKVGIVQDWPVPLNVKQVRQFVGLAQYFRKFIQGFSTLIAPLTALFRKDAVWTWSDKCQSAFLRVKEALISAPCLKLPDNDLPYTLVCDASGVGVGAVLLQEGRPVAFDGRKLTDTEMKWGATEQEMLAVVHHLEKWRCYLEGSEFTVVTDHQPNTWFSTQKVLSPRLARWYERIRSFEFSWEYRPGRLNVADPLSRHPAFTALIGLYGSHDRLPQSVCLMQLRSAGETVQLPSHEHHHIVRHSREVRSMLDQAHSSLEGKGRNTALKHRHGESPRLSSNKQKSVPVPLINSEFSMPVNVTDNGIQKLTNTDQNMQIRPADNYDTAAPCQTDQDSTRLITGGKGVKRHADWTPGMAEIPSVLTSELDIANLQPVHMATDTQTAGAPLISPLINVGDVLQSVKHGYTKDILFDNAHVAERNRLGLSVSAGGLWLKGKAIVIPDVPGLRRSIMHELHCSPYAGHVGMNKTVQLISKYFYWPNMQQDINPYVRGCELCQRNKSASGKTAGKLQPLPVPEQIWEDISMDFVGPLPVTKRKHDFILVVVDRLSKMAHFLPCKSTIDGPGTARLFIDRIWSLHGLPKSIVTDRGTQFLNAFNAEVLKLVGTKHAATSSYHPESDGQTERVNRVLTEMLRHYVNLRYDDWDMHLPLVEFAHNNIPTTATGLSPFFVCYGKHPRTPMDSVVEAAYAEWDANPEEHPQFPVASDFVQTRQTIVQHARAAMESARQRMQNQTDDKRRELSFTKGAQVSLKTKHLGVSTLPSRKLFQKWMGPFTVEKVINPVAYQLALPNHWKAHNVFHVSLLKPFLSNGEAVPPQSFTLVGGKDNELEVEYIYGYGPKSLKTNGKPRKVSELSFWVKWRGIRQGMDARQPYANVKGNALDALRDLAVRWGLPEDTFAKGSNLLPAYTKVDYTHLPPPPLTAATCTLHEP